MFDIIINPVQGPTIPTYVPLIGGWPINSPLMGSFIGVVGGFAANYLYSGLKNKCKRLYYIEIIKSELNQAKTDLERDKKDELFVNPLKDRKPSKIRTCLAG